MPRNRVSFVDQIAHIAEDLPDCIGISLARLKLDHDSCSVPIASHYVDAPRRDLLLSIAVDDGQSRFKLFDAAPQSQLQVTFKPECRSFCSGNLGFLRIVCATLAAGPPA